VSSKMQQPVDTCGVRRPWERGDAEALQGLCSAASKGVANASCKTRGSSGLC